MYLDMFVYLSIYLLDINKDRIKLVLKLLNASAMMSSLRYK